MNGPRIKNTNNSTDHSTVTTFRPSYIIRAISGYTKEKYPALWQIITEAVVQSRSVKRRFLKISLYPQENTSAGVSF